MLLLSACLNACVVSCVQRRDSTLPLPRRDGTLLPLLAPIRARVFCRDRCSLQGTAGRWNEGEKQNRRPAHGSALRCYREVVPLPPASTQISEDDRLPPGDGQAFGQQRTGRMLLLLLYFPG